MIPIHITTTMFFSKIAPIDNTSPISGFSIDLTKIEMTKNQKSHIQNLTTADLKIYMFFVVHTFRAFRIVHVVRFS